MENKIKEWKAKYRDVFEISVEGKTCYLRKPDRKVLGFAAKASEKNPLAFNEVILKNCWLDGDEEIRTNDDYYLAVSGKLSEIIEIKEAEIKKL